MTDLLQTAGLIILACVVLYMFRVQFFTLGELAKVWKEFGSIHERLFKVIRETDQ